MSEGDQGPEQVWYSAGDFAQITGFSINTVWYWVRNGEVPYTRIGGSIRIHREVLQQMLATELANERSVA